MLPKGQDVESTWTREGISYRNWNTDHTDRGIIIISKFIIYKILFYIIGVIPLSFEAIGRDVCVHSPAAPAPGVGPCKQTCHWLGSGE
jgi:hypothetical protein